jgi:hypothetical protein
MMGRLKSDQCQLFYEFHLSEAVPEDHLVRKIDAALDLSWLRSELASHYSSMGQIRRGAPQATSSRSSSRHPIRRPSGPELTRARHSSLTPTITSST